MAPVIDLNCDLGETVDGRPTADDEALFSIITSANVACGFHAGDVESMRVSCLRAAERGVRVGAHVSYADREGFGRRPIDLAPELLTAQVAEQIAALRDAADAAHITVSYIKAHGALYNRVALAAGEGAGGGGTSGETSRVDASARDDENTARRETQAQAQAHALAQAAASAGLPLLGIGGSVLERAAAARNVPFYYEAFPDRGYTPDGLLAPRGTPGALIDVADRVAARAVGIAAVGAIEAIDGTVLNVRPHSLCVHGDTPGSVAIARAVRAGLEQAGTRLEAFA